MYVQTGETSTAKVLWTVKRSTAYIGFVPKAALKEKYGEQCLLRVVFSCNFCQIMVANMAAPDLLVDGFAYHVHFYFLMESTL